MAAQDRSIIDVGYLRQWSPQQIGLDDVALQLAIQAASESLESWCGRLFRLADVVEYHDGIAAHGGDRDALKLSAFPIVGNPTVTENGTALVVAEGYSTSADVIFESNRGLLKRRPGNTTQLIAQDSPTVPALGWSQGHQNVVVTYKAGWLLEDMPHHIRHLCAEIAWRMYDDPRRSGQESVSRAGGGSSRFVDTLSMSGREIYAGLKAESSSRNHTAARIAFTTATS